MAFELWQMALKNLSRNKRRNVATASAIICGVAGITAAMAYYHHESNSRRVFTVYTSRLGHLHIYHPQGVERFPSDPQTFSLTPEETAGISKVLNEAPEVMHHGAQIHGVGLISNGCHSFPFQILGLDPELDKKIGDHPELQIWGTDAHKQFQGQRLWDVTSVNGGVLVSNGLAQALEKPLLYSEVAPNHVPEPIDCSDTGAAQTWAQDSYVQMSANSWQGNPSVIDGQIVGRFNPGSSSTNNNLVIAPLKVVQSLFGTDRAMRHVVWLKQGHDVGTTAPLIQDRLVQAGYQLEVRRFDDERVIPTYAGTLGFIDILLGFVNVLVCMVICFSVFNAANITVLERSKEIGMLRALGYTRRRIRVLFAMEAATLSVGAISVGAIFGHGLTGLLNGLQLPYRTPGMDMAHHAMVLTHNYSTMSLMTVAVFALSLGSTYFAAWAVAEKNVAYLLTGPGH